MKNRQNRNLGSPKYSTRSQKCRTVTNISSSVDSNVVSKYFKAITPENTNTIVTEPNDSFESPYKNLISENRTPNTAASPNEDQDFKTPQKFKTSKITKTVVEKAKSKRGRVKKPKQQESILKMLKRNNSDTNPDHLQVAIALSESSYEMECKDDLSKNKKPANVTVSLEQFGFTKSNNSRLAVEKRRIEVPKKRNKLSRFAFLTPVLKLRTEEDRQALINSKISLILGQTSHIEESADFRKHQTSVTSDILRNFWNKTREVFNTDKIYETHRFYSNSIHIEKSAKKICGCLLRDWENIYGLNDLTEETSNNKSSRQDSGIYSSTNSTVSTSEDLGFVISSSNCDSGIKSCVETFNERCISPDLFGTSDEDSFRSTEETAADNVKRLIDSNKPIKNALSATASSQAKQKSPTSNCDLKPQVVWLNNDQKTRLNDEENSINTEDFIKITNVLDLDSIKATENGTQLIDTKDDKFTFGKASNRRTSSHHLSQFERESKVSLLSDEDIHSISVVEESDCENEEMNPANSNLSHEGQAEKNWRVSQDCDNETRSMSQQSIREEFASKEALDTIKPFKENPSKTITDESIPAERCKISSPKSPEEIIEISDEESSPNSSNNSGFMVGSNSLSPINESNIKYRSTEIFSDNKSKREEQLSESSNAEINLMSFNNDKSLSLNVTDYVNKLLNCEHSNIGARISSFNTEMESRDRERKISNEDDVEYLNFSQLSQEINDEELNYSCNYVGAHEAPDDVDAQGLCDDNCNVSNEKSDSAEELDDRDCIVQEVNTEDVMDIGSLRQTTDRLLSKLDNSIGYPINELGDSKDSLGQINEELASYEDSNAIISSFRIKQNTPDSERTRSYEDNVEDMHFSQLSQEMNDDELNYSCNYVSTQVLEIDKSDEDKQLLFDNDCNVHNERRAQEVNEDEVMDTDTLRKTTDILLSNLENLIGFPIHELSESNDSSKQSQKGSMYDEDDYEVSEVLEQGNLVSTPLSNNLSQINEPVVNVSSSLSQNLVDNEIIPVATPASNFIIKRDNITPMPEYTKMNTPNIHKELSKFGMKPMKRKRGVKLLEYIYDATHPFVDDGVTEMQDTDDGCHVLKKRQSSDIGSVRDYVEAVTIVGDELLKNETELFFERKSSAKISTCQVPLQIVWHNFLECNRDIQEQILLYEPLHLEKIHLLLKGLGFKFNIQDLLTFFDRKCITVRTNKVQTKQKENG